MAAPSDSSTFTLAQRALRLDTAADVETHFSALRSNSNYSTISLNGNTLGVPAAAALASLLSAQRQLRSINLADLFTGRLVTEIPAALSHLLTALLSCHHLATVDLSDNAFGLKTVEPLVAFLRQHAPLQHLILNNNGLGPQAGGMVAEALAQLSVVKEKARAAAAAGGAAIPDLETVVCGRNRLESGSMAAWAKACRALPGLTTLRMAQDGIRQEGIVVLLRDGLRHCGNLQVLDMQDNTFTVAGSTALAEVLPSWPALKELGVGDCLVGAKGFVKVAEALGKNGNPALEVLRAQYGEIDVRGVKKLAEVLKAGGLPKLRRVELNGNKFAEEDASAMELAEVLAKKREEAGVEEDDEGWGLDELSDMEDDDDEDEEDQEEEEAADEEKGKRDKVLKEADEQEQSKVALEKDKEVDDLAEQLGKQL